ncbi:hypothetical protein GC194_05795 [bacterium]|nr:hypothetical protein [bacterium]
MSKQYLTLLVLIGFGALSAAAQPKAYTFKKATEMGIGMSLLDLEYPSALNQDTTKAVFKSEEQQKAFVEAYRTMLFDLGKFLSEHGFDWERKTRCFNKIYFNSGGGIDYFLYNFLGSESEKPSEVKQARFNELLQEFVKDYKIKIQAEDKFSQCGPVSYMPKAEEE